MSVKKQKSQDRPIWNLLHDDLRKDEMKNALKPNKKPHRHCWHSTVFIEEPIDSKGCGLSKIWEWCSEIPGENLCCKCGERKP